MENSSRDGNTRPSLSPAIPVSGQEEKELSKEQLTGSKLGKEYNRAIHCQPAYLTYMQSTLGDMPDWMNPKLESRLPGKITISDMQMIPLQWLKAKRNQRAS